jgi:hypothetical protein
VAEHRANLMYFHGVSLRVSTRGAAWKKRSATHDNNDGNTKVKLNKYCQQGRKNTDTRTRAQKHQSMTWAQRLERVFETETYEQFCGAVKVIVSVSKSLGKPTCIANAALQGVDTRVCQMYIRWCFKRYFTWIQKMTKSSNYYPHKDECRLRSACLKKAV